MLLILLCCLVSMLVLGAAFALRWWTWRPVVKRRVLVQTDFDVTFDGVVLTRRGQLLVLGNVTVNAAGQSHRADGVVIVERARVLWMQAA